MEDHQLAGLIVFLMASFGFTCNALVVIFFRFLPSLANSFGKLTLSQAIADGTHQFIFAFYVGPMLFFQLPSWMNENTTGNFGHVLVMAYQICCFSHVSLASNRFCAIYFPLAYNQIFSTRNTVVLICAYWTVCIFAPTYIFTQLDCSFYIPLNFWFYIYKDTASCHVVMWYIDFIKYMMFVSVVATLDCLTILRINLTNRRVHGAADQQSIRRRRQEIFLVWQACLQGIFFTAELITYFWLVGYAQNQWQSFFLTTVSWILVHGMDGAIVLICNRDVRAILTKGFKHIHGPSSSGHEGNPTVNTRATTGVTTIATRSVTEGGNRIHPLPNLAQVTPFEGLSPDPNFFNGNNSDSDSQMSP